MNSQFVCCNELTPEYIGDDMYKLIIHKSQIQELQKALNHLELKRKAARNHYHKKKPEARVNYVSHIPLTLKVINPELVQIDQQPPTQ